jgi:purine-binding chemotaxis protein CheW
MQENMTESTSVAEQEIKVRPGKYLTFFLGNEQYGLEIMKVQDIISMMSITRVPKTPEFIRGVINLRGKVIPILDLRIKFDMEHQEDTRVTCIINLQVTHNNSQMVIGVVVDEVSEVVNISADQLQPPPAFGENINVDMIIGVGNIEDRVVLLFDADRLLSNEEMSSVTSMS